MGRCRRRPWRSEREARLGVGGEVSVELEEEFQPLPLVVESPARTEGRVDFFVEPVVCLEEFWVHGEGVVCLGEAAAGV